MPLPTAPFDAAKSIFAGLSVIQLAFAATPITGVAATTAGVFTKTGHTLTDGTPLRFDSGTGGEGLTVGTTYYVRDAAANTFKLAPTPGGVAITLTSALSAATFSAAAVFEATKVDSKLSEEKKHIERPDKKGVLRKQRTVTTRSDESFVFDVQEVKRLLDIFGGSLTGSARVSVTLWIPDPDDATGKVALKSEDNFPATISREGDLSFGGGEFSQSNILIESNKPGAITWTADAAV
ncbi:hypothetical protein H5P28_00325 [Ruficoccus amylovorans]|uniref:Uncharacterized protein n=1 Tax=Ruficoccus amylovorans TaxID=1804625 RepID=A0A842HAN5_9BACT|nr:hypothetical protein [Ruficoccus amylovorans]MBC2592697.1 hypothetical protein [Ruficoccus amylovorans]